MNITEYLKSALSSNLPIDFKSLAIQIHDLLVKRIGELELENQVLKEKYEVSTSGTESPDS